MLEEQANKPTGIKQITLPPGTIKFITGLMEKYGDNYKVNLLLKLFNYCWFIDYQYNSILI